MELPGRAAGIGRLGAGREAGLADTLIFLVPLAGLTAAARGLTAAAGLAAVVLGLATAGLAVAGLAIAGLAAVRGFAMARGLAQGSGIVAWCPVDGLLPVPVF